jgi:hypothetical protein
MPEGSEERLGLLQADQVRGDLYAIHGELEFIRAGSSASQRAWTYCASCSAALR